MRVRTPFAVAGAVALVLFTVPAVAQDTGGGAAAAQDEAAARRDGLITTADIKAWNTIRQTVLSNDGRWFAYVLAPNEGNGSVIWRRTSADAEETRVDVGEGGGSIAISGDSRWLGYIVAPPRQASRGGAQARQGAGAEGAQARGDSAAAPRPTANKLVLVDLANGGTREFERIRRFSFNGERATWVAMVGYGTAETPAQGAAPTGGAPGGRGGGPGAAPGASAPAGGAPLLLYNLETAELFNMGSVGEYAFDDSGEWLAYTMQTPDRVGNGVQLRNMRTNVVRSLESERLIYRHLAWVDSSRALSVMRAKIENGARDTVFSVVAFGRIGASGAGQRLEFDPSRADGFPEGWKLASERAPRWARDMSAVYVGIREANRPPVRGMPQVTPGAPGMGGRVNQGQGGATDSVPSLILWHSKDPRLQSQQIVQENQERSFNYLAAYRFDDRRFVRLADDELRSVTVTTGDRYAYGVDTRAYERNASVSGRNYQDVYSVDLRTGERRLLLEKRPSGALSASPDGRRLLFWGDNGHWWLLDLATGDTVNVTSAAPVSFTNPESGYNDLYPRVAGPGQWSRDGRYVVLSDGWDHWRVEARAGGAAVNLTGDGRERQVRYQRIYNFPRGRQLTPQPGLDLSQPLYFATYGEWTKQEGLARVDARRPGAQQLFAGDARFSIVKARDADVYLYTRQTFAEYPNWWVFNQGFRDGYRITDANPQMKDLAWSSGARLIDYTSAKGTRLQGALYLPANYEPGRRYPLLVTIYERRSQNLHNFVSPSETRAPDPSRYTNRGYAVLDPDITYHVNDPGMSAVWAVVPAVEAAVATGIVDPERVGLWGHSWGGYQTAFLVTQTNIFAAAVAGAPLTDMISMYSSVYWNTGGANQAIFESSQGRFKGNFLENTEAYIRNSPAYHADKVQTPLIIMHNDKDGAVDFNQGITYFNTLRQLGKDVVLLEYVGENHGLSRPANQRDYAERMAEWFDHYLKGEPPADWITDGVPRLQMDEHLRKRREAASRPITATDRQ